MFHRECFLPMSELSNLKQFSAHINLVFPGGALFLVCNDAEFKRLFMDLTCTFLKGNHRNVHGVSVIGRNKTSDGDVVWMFSPSTQLDEDGNWIQSNTSQFVWLPSANGVDSDKRLHCNICTPLDDGEALKNLYAAVEAFMPDNSVACLATMASCVMGAAYQQIINASGHVGVPFLFGEPGSCKTEAILCGLSLFGAHDTS